jgi:hypothetical protein
MYSRGGQPPHELGLQCGVGALLWRGGDDVLSCAAHRWSSCKITWMNFVFSLLMPAKKNCASAWANHTAGRSAQNGGSRMATLDTSAGVPLSVAYMLLSGSPMWECTHAETLPNTTGGVLKHSHEALVGCQSTTT